MAITEKDDKLVSALRDAKKAPMNFAFVAKGTSDGCLLLSKKSIPVKEINDAKKDLGATLVIRGRCFAEEGQMVFEVAKEQASTLGKQIKTVMQRDAGQVLKVEIRVNATLEVESDERPVPPSPVPDAAKVSTPPAPPPPPSAAPPGSLADLIKRLNGVSNDIKNALAQKLPQAAQIQTLIGAVNEAIKAKNAAQGNQLLDELARLLAQAKASPPEAGPSYADLLKRLNTLAPEVKAVLAQQHAEAGRIQTMFTTVGGLLSKKELLTAAQTLNELQTELAKLKISTSAAPSPSLAALVMELAKNRLSWQQARDKVTVQLGELREAIIDEIDDENVLAVSNKLKSVDQQLEEFSTKLVDALDDILNAADDKQRKIALDAARKIAEPYLGFAESNPLLQHAIIHPLEAGPIEAENLLAEPLRRLIGQLQKAAA